MLRYQNRINKVANNLAIDKEKVVDVIESIETFLKDGMASMTLFALKVPGIGTFKMNKAYRGDAIMINEFDRLFITDKQLQAYELKRNKLNSTIDTKESNNKSSSTGN